MRPGLHRLALLLLLLLVVGYAVARPPDRSAAPAGSASWSSDPSVPRDVVLIVIDTLRADHLPIYGYARDTAPHLAAFARQAVTFTQATSPGTWTVPSHAS